MHQIEVGFFICPAWADEGGRVVVGVFKRGNPPSLVDNPHPHPLVTERGGDAVNYKRARRPEQWFIRFHHNTGIPLQT